ncbi:outer membrane protein assembly factor BamB family protein [Nannocystis radixulma]|uniref:PQQ-binding-like beta-propeller repeat protein n=1 Tax=Nannocystis radixulma TaxID=2995305 RepID=A0ABT5BEB4_9BACT|nr:PQQ-binding-like beta-propeller repeat protein [Nannocystis radixulma]MDC0672497.1 PQQ-binding-like beta-propeller repeat protein [Nannocystis radixulma]
MNFSARTTALVTLALAGCVPSIVVGDQPQDEAVSESTSEGPPDATSEPTTTTTTGEPGPPVCGDGIVAAGEACDDGNDEPNDGCDADCSVTGEVVWTVEGPGQIFDLAVAPDGTIIACGRDSIAFLTAFAPDGTELWSRQVNSYGEIAVDAAGRIFVLSSLAGVHSYEADGADRWGFLPGGKPLDARGIDVDDEQVYIATFEGDSDRLIVRGVDVDSGEIVWETLMPVEEEFGALDLTVLGDRVYAVGSRRTAEPALRAAAAVFTTSGELLPFALEDGPSLLWTAAAVAGDGDLVLAGYGGEAPGFLLRRVGADLSEQWTSITPGPQPSKAERIAVGPGGQIAAAGSRPTDHGGLVRLYDGAGALLWASQFIDEDAEVETTRGAAFGPDFLTVAGYSVTGTGPNPPERWWVRRFALD